MQEAASFGTWLKQRRKALDLTQEELAERSGCSIWTIRKLEMGERRPSRQVAQLLAEALLIPPADQPSLVSFARTEAPPEATHPASLPATEPAAAPASAAPLPVPLTLLLGREGEFHAASALLGGAHGRLLTMTGPPGVGKTRLALALAAALAPEFPDGACFVPLAPLRDPALLADYVARALGQQDGAGGPPGERLGAYLRNQRLLLVLDNFEQVVAAAPQVGEWLSSAPGVRILVTSRAALGLRGERRFPVPPLAVPPPDAAAQPEALMAYPSVALFAERAQAVDPAFQLTQANAESIAALCTWLEGVPLAIELAAARSARLSPQEVRAGLSRRLDLSARGLRDLPVHQQSLRAALAWSYDLLNPAEQHLLARLAVFSGGATWEAVDAVGNAHCDLEGGALSALEGLLEQSLVRREASPEGPDRFTLLELVREYAQERLEASGEGGELGRLHAEYFLALAEQVDASLHGPQQGVLLARLEREHDNFRAAFTWAAEHGARALELRLAGALGWFWRLRGHWEEGARRLTRALEQGPAEPTAGRARALLARAFLAYVWEDHETARRTSEEALAIYRTLRDSRGVAQALFFLSLTAGSTDDRERRQALLQESLEVARAAGDRWGVAKALYGLGTAAWMRGDLPGARRLLEESAALFRALGDPRETALTMHNLGQVLVRQGALETAGEALAESLALWQELRDLWGVGVALHSLSQVARRQGDFSAAADLLEEALALAQEAGDLLRQAGALWGLGDLAYCRGNDVQARRYFSEALTLYQGLGNELAAEMQVGLAWLALHQGALAEAEQRSLASLGTMTQRHAVEALGSLAGLAAAQGQLVRAACLLGALDALGTPLAEIDHAWADLDVPRLRERVRAALPAEEFAAAWEAGEALGWEEARALTLSEGTQAPLSASHTR